MTPRALIDRYLPAFVSAGIEDAKNDCAVLLASVLNRPWLELLFDRDTELSQAQEEAFQLLCTQRIQRKPLQYLTGEQAFCGRTFQVDERVLIPRPETEELALLCLEKLQSMDAKNPSVLDLCCGSGCLGLTIALECPQSEVLCSDLSPQALSVAQENARRLGAKIRLQQSDLLDSLTGERFDLIVSNPPYIPSDICASLQAEVLCEPILALDGGKDGLDFYRRIVAQASSFLIPGGWLMLEIGWDQGEAVRSLLLRHEFRNVSIRKDLQGKDRMVEAQL